jgi:hypothetical protein
MEISNTTEHPPWLLLIFTLPTKRASQRVEVWRKLQRYGAIPLGNSGYLLPNDAANREHFEWLATAIRNYGGDASVVHIQSIDNLSTSQLISRFGEARAREYQEVVRELQKLAAIPPHKRAPGRLTRLRTRYREIAGIDFFDSPLKKQIEKLLDRAGEPADSRKEPSRINPKEYKARLWVTRPRPGIDRSASAWLIRRFIDTKARFAFATENRVPKRAVPFDMFQIGFGHHGEDCTFETLQKMFRIRGKKIEVIGQIVHDADLLDEKFGRKEGFGIEGVLNGWQKLGIPDRQLLDRGIELFEALFLSLSEGEKV